VNIDTASFNIIMGQMTDIPQRKRNLEPEWCQLI